MKPQRSNLPRAKRDVGRWAAACAVLLVLACTSSGRGERPNIVLIVLDTTRADFLSSYGHPRNTSPNIDRLAREGVLFRRAYATDFWTLPSHASLLTGRHPTEIQATAETNQLPARATTLAEILLGAGYRTGAVVTNGWLNRERGFDQGFQEYFEMWRRVWRRHSPPAGRRFEGDLAIGLAIDWIADRAREGDPFFLFVNLNTAHLPYTPHPEILKRFLSPDRPASQVSRLQKVSGMWGHLAGKVKLDPTDLAILRELYEAEIATADLLVGRLIAALEGAGILDGTLVIVTSDHGENIGDHGMIDHLLSMYDTTIHVPLIMRYPKRFRSGSVNEELVSLVDVVPTVLDISGLAPPDDVPAARRRSLASRDASPPAAVFAENDRPINGVELMKKQFPDFDTRTIDQRMRMVRTEDHKLIWKERGDVELFDLREDASEERDIAGRDAATREELLRILETWTDSLDPGEVVPRLESRDAESIEQLRELGYVE